jgi:hypothetical protein
LAGRGNTEPTEGGRKILWNGIVLEEESLARWALGEIGRLRQDLVPHTIRKLRIQATVSDGQIVGAGK